jgi:electron transfer flavoprotein beta subunit
LFAPVARGGARIDEQAAASDGGGNFVRRHHGAALRCATRLVMSRGKNWCVLLDRKTCFLPRSEAAIQHGTALVPEPPEQPPEPCGDGAAAFVVSDDEVAGANSPPAERRRETLWIRQRVAAFVGRRPPRQVPIEMRIPRAGQMAAIVGGPARSRVRQRESAVDDDPIIAPELARQSGDVDEWLVAHRVIVTSRDSIGPMLRSRPLRRAGDAQLQSIMVGIKRVVDYNLRVRVKADGSGIVTEGLKTSINPFDEIALEAALRLRESGACSTVVLVTLGRAEAERELRTGLALGADRAIRVDAPASAEPLLVARALLALARRENPLLVLLGKQAVDDDHGQTGQMLAALWERPQATFASALSVTGGVATVAREIDAGLETLEVDLPAVVTTDLRLNQPRYPKLPDILKAKTKPLAVVPLAELGVEHTPQFAPRGYSPPPARAAGMRVKNVRELVAALEARGALS